MIDLNLFIVFDAIYTTGSVKAAAEKLNVSSPAISASLSKLRVLYNEPLFIRNGRGLKKTTFATELHKETKEHLSYLINSQNLFSNFDPQKTERMFSIATESDLDLIFFNNLIDQINQSDSLNIVKYNDIKNKEDIENSLRLRKVDLIITSSPINERSYVNEKITSEKLIAVVKKDHPRIDNKITKSDFFKEKHSGWESLSGSKMVFESSLKEKEKERNIVYTSNSNLNLLFMTMNQDWITITSENIFNLVKDLKKLKQIELPFELEELSFYITYHKSFEKDKGLLWLKERIKKSFNPDN